MINVLTTKIYSVTVTELDAIILKPKKRDKKTKTKTNHTKTTKINFLLFILIYSLKKT